MHCLKINKITSVLECEGCGWAVLMRVYWNRSYLQLKTIYNHRSPNSSHLLHSANDCEYKETGHKIFVNEVYPLILKEGAKTTCKKDNCKKWSWDSNNFGDFSYTSPFGRFLVGVPKIYLQDVWMYQMRLF